MSTLINIFEMILTVLVLVLAVSVGSQTFPFNSTLSTLINQKVSENVIKNVSFNMSATPIYNVDRKKIVFNLTWTKPPDLDVSIYKFKISTNCSIETIESTETDVDYNFFNILIPSPLIRQEILPGCPYKISMVAEITLDNQTIIENSANVIEIDVPKCVGQKCSCRLLSPKFVDLSVTEIEPGVLKVAWRLEESKNVKNRANLITDKMFEYRAMPDTQQGRGLHANPFKKLPTSVHLKSLQENFTIIKNASSYFPPDQKYEMRAIFTNQFGCKAYDYVNVTINKVVVMPNLPTKRSSLTAWIISFILASILILIVSYFVWRKRQKIKTCLLNLVRSRKHREEYNRRNSYLVVPNLPKRMQEVNMIYVDKEIVEGSVDKYEFPRSRLTFVKKIGSGAFGEVFLAKAFGIKNSPSVTYVAVKKLNERAPPEEMDDFLSEIEILKKIGEHPNIVRIFGCCKLTEPYLMVMEFVPCGDLLHYLLDLRKKWSRNRTISENSSLFTDSSDGAYITPNGTFMRNTPERPSITETEYTTLSSDGFLTPTDQTDRRQEDGLSHTELQQFALQIACGMEHLEKIPIAHRDLAARNILIDEFKVLKISDFGLSRVGPYVNSRTQKLPLRWVSLEAIEDHFYDSKGDVWSFGIVLWEIGTLGAFPYEEVANNNLLRYLAGGNRLSRPEICTDEMYALMLRCWNRDPQLRPSFKELVQFLDVKRKRVYVDFGQLNPLYVFPPSRDEKGTLVFKDRVDVSSVPASST